MVLPVFIHLCREVMDLVELACRDLAKKCQQKQQKEKPELKISTPFSGETVEYNKGNHWVSCLQCVWTALSGSSLVRLSSIRQVLPLPGLQHLQSFEAMHQPLAARGGPKLRLFLKSLRLKRWWSVWDQIGMNKNSKEAAQVTNWEPKMMSFQFSTGIGSKDVPTSHPTKLSPSAVIFPWPAQEVNQVPVKSKFIAGLLVNYKIRWYTLCYNNDWWMSILVDQKRFSILFWIFFPKSQQLWLRRSKNCFCNSWIGENSPWRPRCSAGRHPTIHTACGKSVCIRWSVLYWWILNDIDGIYKFDIV